MGGGVGLVAIADWAIADKAVRIGTPEVTVGLVPAQIAASVWLFGGGVWQFLIEEAAVEVGALATALTVAMIRHRPTGLFGVVVGVLLTIAAVVTFVLPVVASHEGRIARVHGPAAQWTGTAEEDLVGSPVPESWPGLAVARRTIGAETLFVLRALDDSPERDLLVRQAEALRGFGAMCHRINNPLTALVGRSV